MDENNIITLNDENGNDVKFEFIDLVKYMDDDYAVLLPYDDEEDNTEVVILQVSDINEDESNQTYLPVDDEQTLIAVFEIFKGRFKDVFDFED